MKVKDLADFLSKCDPDADLRATLNGHWYLPIGAVVQGHRNLQTNEVCGDKRPDHEEYGVYIFGNAITFLESDVSPTDICLIDPEMMKNEII
jgi:hypothetical protein